MDRTPNAPTGSDEPRHPTSREAQHATILKVLRQHPETTCGFRERGIMQVSTRVKELREMGFVLRTELYSGLDTFGKWHHRMARYHLVSEPASTPGAAQ